ncbi:MAG: hypothetical protein ACK5Q5_15280 [Planctomycetaceae bacterium]
MKLMLPWGRIARPLRITAIAASTIRILSLTRGLEYRIALIPPPPPEEILPDFLRGFCSLCTESLLAG